MLLTCTYHSADCDTDHSLVCCKIRLQPKKLCSSKQKGKPRINTTSMQFPEIVEESAKYLEDVLSEEHQHHSASEKWDRVSEAIQKTALVKSSEMTPVTDTKRVALAEYKRSPSEKSLQALRAARSKVQRTARRCANEYWQQFSDSVQTAAASGNIRGMYECIKTALSSTQSKTAPLKTTSGEVITDKGKQMDRWLEHYSGLYAKENLELAERVHPESQCGFQAERSTVDKIFSLQQLQVTCREQHKPLYIAFIYLTKAFDLGQYLAQSFLFFLFLSEKG